MQSNAMTIIHHIWSTEMGKYMFLKWGEWKGPKCGLTYYCDDLRKINPCVGEGTWLATNCGTNNLPMYFIEIRMHSHWIVYVELLKDVLI